MASNPKKIYHGQPTNAATTLYTVPALTSTIIRHIRAINPDTVSHTFDLWVNGSADANRVTETITVPAGGSVEDDVYVVMGAADTLQGKADTSSKVTVYVSGAEVS